MCVSVEVVEVGLLQTAMYWESRRAGVWLKCSVVIVAIFPVLYAGSCSTPG